MALPESELRSISRNFGTIIPGAEITSDQTIELRNLLEELFESAEAGRLGASHRAAACNALCGFLDTTISSSIDQVKSISINQQVWERIISLYFDRFSESSAPSMKQVLNTSINLLTARAIDEDGHSSPGWIWNVSTSCLEYIYCSNDFGSIKPAMILLEALMSKGLIDHKSVFEILSKIHQELFDPDEFREFVASARGNLMRSISQTFVRKILKWSKNPDASLTSGRLLKTLFSDDAFSTVMTTDEDGPVWLQPVLEMAEDQTTDLDRLEKHIVTEILLADEANVLSFIRKLKVNRLVQNQSIPESEIRFTLSLFNVMQHMKLSSHIRASLRLELGVPVEGLRDTLAIECLRHQSPHIRIAAAGMIVFTQGTASVFTEIQLQALRSALHIFFADADAKVRGNVTNLVKKLTARLLLVINKLRKNMRTIHNGDVTAPVHPKVIETCLYYHVEFVQWFKDFLCTEMRPSASYQRHILALKSVNLVSTLDLFSCCEIDIFSGPVIREIAEMVMDPYDDVRGVAAALLRKQPKLHSSIIDPYQDESVISIAKKRMIGTGRASISDGYARLVELSYHFSLAEKHHQTAGFCTPQSILSDIDVSLHRAALNLQAAVSNSQLHGQFSALRYIISHPQINSSFSDETEWREFHESLFNSCRQAWKVVKPILCIDSPEGQGDEEDMQDLDIGGKDTLSFSWRTLKEASSLMQSMVSSPYYGHITDHALTYKDIKKLGKLSFEQLSELRHRGAFTTVAQCFTTICIKCGGSDSADTQGLPQKWYKKALRNIDENAAALTRRSAGLPALMTGILASDPVGDLFDEAMLDLQGIANLPVDEEHEHGKTGLPQVHAMNCIKDIFGNSRLGPSSEKHLEECLHIAVQSLQNKTFSIVNCGGMLLKAILNRLNNGANTDLHHVHEQHIHRFKAIYNRFPALSVAVDGLLQASVSVREAEDHDSRVIHVNTGLPALDIIDRIGVKDDHQAPVTEMLFLLLESPVWRLRERAAGLLGKLINGDELVIKLCQAIESDFDSKCVHSNSLHGQLMCMKYAVEKTSQRELKRTLPRLVSASYHIIPPLSHHAIVSLFDALGAIFLRQSLKDVEISESLLDVVREFPFEELVNDGMVKKSNVARFKVLRDLWFTISDHNVDMQEEKESGEKEEDLLVYIHEATKVFIKHPRLLDHWSNRVGSWILTLFSTIDHGFGDPFTMDVIESMNELLNLQEVFAYQNAIIESSKASEFKKFYPVNVNLRIPPAIIEFFLVVDRYLPLQITWDLTPGVFCLKMSEEQNFESRLSHMKLVYQLRSAIFNRFFDRRDSSMKKLNKYHLLGLFYEGLNDDESQIRDLTADIVSYIFSECREDQVPPSTTSISAQEYLFDHFTQDKVLTDQFVDIVLSRLLGLPIESIGRSSSNNKAMMRLTLDQWSENHSSLQYSSIFRESGPAAKVVLDVLVEDNTLFEEERQNLYKDNVQEMEKWAGLLIKMGRRDTGLATYLDWAIEGLKTIEESAGSPGWTYRREGFEAVCQVLIFTKVVQSWIRQIKHQHELYNAVLRVENKLAIVHPEHTRLIEELKAGFMEMDLDR